MRILTPEESVVLCTNLEIASADWMAAVSTLSVHPKERVIGYIRQVSTSQNLLVRYACYKLCKDCRWKELAKQAEVDLENRELLPLVQGGVNETLGKAAKRYLEAIAEHR